MTTIEIENMDLRVVQQNSEVCESGKQYLRGAITINHDEGYATFVENAKKATVSKNPILCQGQYLTLRTDKEGKVRGTFRVDVPINEKSLDTLASILIDDMSMALGCLDTLTDAHKSKKRKKSKKSA